MGIKRASYIVFVWAFLCSIISCDSSNDRLREAEALLETNPKAADSILCSMPEPQSRSNRAWYAVLKTQADYKQYKPITSDSLILTATKYYGIRHRNYRSAMAWYSQGCVYSELNDDVSAINAYLKAKFIFPDTLIRYFALTEQQLALCYLSKGMYKESQIYFEQCRNIANSLGESAIIAYSDYHLALIQLQNHRFEGLNNRFRVLLKNKHLSKYYRNEALLELAKYHIYHTGCYDSAMYYLNLKVKESGASLGATNNLKGEIFYLTEKIDSAYQYYLQSLNVPNDIYTQCNSYKRLGEISLLYGNNQDAFSYGQLYTESIDSIRMLRNANDIAAISIAHNEEIDTIERREFRTRTLLLTLLILLITITLSIAAYQYSISKMRERYIHFSDEMWSNIKKPLSPDSSETTLLESAKKKYMNSPSHSILFYHRDEYSIFKRSEKEAIKHDVNIAFSDLIIRNINNKTNINSRDLLFCFLNYLEVDKKTVCEILDMSIENYRTIKKRMKEKLGDAFELYFNNTEKE